MQNIAKQALAWALILSSALASASAGTTKNSIIQAPAATSPWKFHIESCAWLTALDGRTGVSLEEYKMTAGSSVAPSKATLRMNFDDDGGGVAKCSTTRP